MKGKLNGGEFNHLKRKILTIIGINKTACLSDMIIRLSQYYLDISGKSYQEIKYVEMKCIIVYIR